ncbi:MAG: ATPase, partial [Bdellovibrio sp.]
RTLSQSYDYLNYDSIEDREMLGQRKWDRRKDLIIFDELHKMPRWKSWLKGIYDTEGIQPQILVTGSARLNALRKVGDSLAGRFFYFRLHPFDLKEVAASNMKITTQEAFSRLITVGGYPEPFLEGETSFYKRWRQTHLDVILRQDLLSLETVRDLASLEVLVQILRSKVGSPISINSIATDLQKDHKTVQRWLALLEELFVVFKVSPYSRDIARSVKKESKYYFFDSAFVAGDVSIKLENLVACALLKEAHFQTDVNGRPYQLYFLKVKGGREIDFLLKPEEEEDTALLLEVKRAESEASPHFKLFSSSFKRRHQVQLVADLKREFTTASGIQIAKAAEWLSDFKI